MSITLSKPSGTSVFPLHGDPDSDCLLKRLLAKQPWRAEIDWPHGFEGGIAHRLDLPTSGAVWVADSLEELAQMRSWFAEKKLSKNYLFLAAKDVDWDENRCQLEIAHHRRKHRRMIVNRGKNSPHRGKWYPADTRFTRIKGNLWRAVITTGVMHQIRVHASFVGIPLKGDRIYGGGHPEDEDGPHFFLHHAGLVGPGGVRTAKVPLPAWLQGAGK